MQPLLESPVSFRLSAEARRRHESAAAQLGMRLSQYLRFRLETEDSVTEQMSQLRLTLLDSLSPGASSGSSERIQLELLLLMRRACAPADLRATHAELERQGITPWTPADR